MNVVRYAQHGAVRAMPIVTNVFNGNVEQAVRRFGRKMKQEGIIAALRARRHHEPEWLKRQKQKDNVVYRIRKGIVQQRRRDALAFMRRYVIVYEKGREKRLYMQDVRGWGEQWKVRAVPMSCLVESTRSFFV